MLDCEQTASKPRAAWFRALRERARELPFSAQSAQKVCRGGQDLAVFSPSRWEWPAAGRGTRGWSRGGGRLPFGTRTEGVGGRLRVVRASVPEPGERRRRASVRVQAPARVSERGRRQGVGARAPENILSARAWRVRGCRSAGREASASARVRAPARVTECKRQCE